MDLFLPENQKFLLNQIALFDSQVAQGKVKPAAIGKENSPDSDTIIGARIRPLLDAEKEKGHVAGVYARSQGGFADIHELRRKVNGRPAITVCDFRHSILFGCGLT